MELILARLAALLGQGKLSNADDAAQMLRDASKVGMKEDLRVANGTLRLVLEVMRHILLEHAQPIHDAAILYPKPKSATTLLEITRRATRL